MMAEESTLYVVAVAAVIVREGKVLAMRRSLTKDAGPGLWETLSGRVMFGEEPLDAVKREIAEECGLEVKLEPRPFTAYQASRLDKPMMLLIYKAAYQAGEVVLSEEHDAYDWLTAKEFANRSSLKKLVDVVTEILS